MEDDAGLFFEQVAVSVHPCVLECQDADVALAGNVFHAVVHDLCFLVPVIQLAGIHRVDRDPDSLVMEVVRSFLRRSLFGSRRNNRTQHVLSAGGLHWKKERLGPLATVIQHAECPSVDLDLEFGIAFPDKCDSTGHCRNSQRQHQKCSEQREGT